MSFRTVKKKLDSSKYGYILLPALAILIVNFISYNGTRIINKGVVHHNLSNGFDQLIPFVPFFIIIYMLAFVQWVCGYIRIGIESRERCSRVLATELIAKIICLVIFIVYPTIVIRPEITGTDIFSRITALVYLVDTPDNLFPSVHCVESYIIFRGSMGMKKVPGWYVPAMGAFSILVFVSTVLVKQHVVVDIIAAIVVSEIAFALARVYMRVKMHIIKRKDCE